MTVQFPEMRARLRLAVAALCDRELHERLWLQGERVSSAELGFDDALLFLVDELQMFERAELVGSVLTDDAELAAFAELAFAVEALIEAIGKLGSFRDAIASGVSWESCEANAEELQRLLNRSSSEDA